MWDTVTLTDEQQLIQREVRRICDDYDAEYWRTRDADEEYPHEFADTIAEHGWFGILIPEAYGGAGMGTTEAVVMMEEIAASGAGFGGAQTIHGAVYTSRPIVNHASEDLKRRLLPSLANGTKTMQAFGLTEPNAGSESTAIETRAERDGDEYVVNGQKIWTSRVDVSDYMLLVARTTPRDDVEKKTAGITLFVVDLEEAREENSIDVQAISKAALNLSHSYEVWFHDLRVPADNVVGEVGEGFYHVLDGLNEERLVIAAEAVGLGEAVLDLAADYAAERRVFDRPIGANQGVQHPLARAYAHVVAAKQLTYHAASEAANLERHEVGVMANTAKFLAAEAAFEAADAAVQTHGGFGIAKEYDVERHFRDARIARIAPIAQELTLSYVAENALGLPRSY